MTPIQAEPSFAAQPGHHHVCGCRESPGRFLAMVLGLGDALDRIDDRAWTKPRRLTQRVLWACSAGATHGQALAWIGGGSTPLQQAIGAEIRPGGAEFAARPRTGETQPIVLRGGRIFTADPARPWAGALRIEGGRIVAVGDNAQVESGGGARVIELDGRLVIPGFNDAHMHHTPDPAGLRLPVDPMADPGLADVAPLIAQAGAASPPGTWLMATMADAIGNDAAVHRDTLDALAPDHPLIILGFTNHRLILNSAALTRLGVDEQAINPIGGIFHRYPDSSRLNGRIDEYAMWGPQRLFAAMASVAEGAASITDLGIEAARFGITTLQNMSWTPIDRYLAMLDASDFPLRMRLIHFPPAGPEGRFVEPPRRTISDRITVHGTKWILDGTPVERTAALGRPYADAPETMGELNFDAEVVAQMIAEQRRNGEQLLLHAIGSAAIGQALDAFEAGLAGERSASCVRMEHGDDLDDSQVARMVALGLPLTINPCHLLMPRYFRPRLGDTPLIGAIGTLQARGIALSIGSDGPLSPFLSLLGAVHNPVAPDSALSLTDALIAYTHGGACAEGMGGEKGRLAPGYFADLAVLSHDLFEISPETWPGVRSELTIVGGEIVHEIEACSG